MSQLMQQHEAWKAARARLAGYSPQPARVRAPAKPADVALSLSRLGKLNQSLPYNGTTMHHGKPRKAVEFAYAMQLVCEDRGVTPDQMLNSPYSAAIAARHMLWTVLYDGNYAHADIARRFGVDHATVRGGIQAFRKFQKGAVA